MKTAKDIRYENLLELVQEFGKGDLTRMLEKSKSWPNKEAENRLSRQYLDQIIKGVKTAKGTPRGVGDDLARQIEDEFDLETGWMDTPRGQRPSSPGQPLPTQEELGLLNWLFMKMRPKDRETLLESAKGMAELAEQQKQQDAG